MANGRTATRPQRTGVARVGRSVLAWGAVLALALCAIALIVGSLAPAFGRLPYGARLEAIQASPHHVDGEFRNPASAATAAICLATLADATRAMTGLRRDAAAASPSWQALDEGVDQLVWLGGHSLFLQLGGKRVLVDPVPGAVQNFPRVDYLVISHDHWDALDHATAVALKGQVDKVIVPLGVGAHFDRWGYEPRQIIEADWNGAVALDGGLTVHVLPALHSSGRALAKNRTLWASLLFEAQGITVFHGGGGAYGAHFAAIGSRFRGVDVAVLSGGGERGDGCVGGMSDGDMVRAATELRARAVLPVGGLAPQPRVETEMPSFRLLRPAVGAVFKLEPANPGAAAQAG